MSSSGLFTCTFAFFTSPLVSRNYLAISTIKFPLKYIFTLGSSTTSATIVASKFSFYAKATNLSAFSLATTTAILSCDSEIANSVPSMRPKVSEFAMP